MTRFLVVANQTLLSDELTGVLKAKALEDPSAEFTLVVPATPVEHQLVREEGHARQVAARRAGIALTRFSEQGLPIVGAHIGEPSLKEAIAEALAGRPADYAGIIVCTFPREVSRWFTSGFDEDLEAAFHLAVTHVVSVHGQIEGMSHSAEDSPGAMRTS